MRNTFIQKNGLLGISMYLVFLSANAQIQVRPLPQPGYEERIRQAVENIRLIDTHEHLMSETEALKNVHTFGCLFENYQWCDMTSSGLLKETDNLWEKVKEAWDAASTTGYGRSSLVTAKELYGIDDLNENTFEELNSRIMAMHQPGYYKKVLKDLSKIDLCIIIGHQSPPGAQDTSFVKSLFQVNGLCYFSDDFNKQTFSLKRAREWHNKYSSQVNSLSDYEQMIDNAFRAEIAKGVIGVKVGWSYSRTLFCEDVPRERAEKIFNKMKARPEKLFTLEEVKPLQDYLFFKVMEHCEKYNLPVQVHTGLQTLNGNYITNSNPTLLANVFFKFPKVRFSLLHAAYPYGGELATLAKNFPNVYIDMAWSQIISPSYMANYLREFLETVPNNKIFAFGGDCAYVEGIFGGAIIARQIVTRCLSEMVGDGYLSEQEAIAVAVKILRKNAITFYNLKIPDVQG